MIEATFWMLVVGIAWSLVGYGLTWIILAWIRDRSAAVPTASVRPMHATMLIAARNEEASIREKLLSVLDQEIAPHMVEVLVVSDGSDDATLNEALSVDDPRVRAFQTPTHGGKARALNAGLARIDTEIVIFSDANSILVPGAMRALLDPFTRPDIGGVCGHPAIDRRRGGWLARAERMFWAYDAALKRAEDRLGGVVSAQGTLYAMRRRLVPDTVPPDVADDLWISLQAPDRGLRLAFASGAQAREVVTGRTKGEFMRRVRSTERGWRGLLSMARLMNPWRTGIYAVQLISHKLMRRLAAFMLPAALILNLALLQQGSFYLVSGFLQIACLGLALAALAVPGLRRLPGAAVLVVFVVGHAAMALGILRALSGVRTQRWSPVREVAR